jgi:hypothetical protein
MPMSKKPYGAPGSKTQEIMSDRPAKPGRAAAAKPGRAMPQRGSRTAKNKGKAK